MSQQRTQPPRQYGADEVQEILQRTSRLERKKQLERPTLQLSEIEAIAREAGLDPSLVRRAAQELELRHGETSAGARFVGVPLRQVFEREVDGEITAAAHETLADEIRSTMGPHSLVGQVSAIGRTLTWAGLSRVGKIELSVFPRDGKTVIRLEVNSSQLAGGLFGGLMGGIGGGLGVNLLWMLPTMAQLPWYSGVAGLGATLIGAWGVARLIYGTAVGRITRRSDGLLDKLERIVRASVSTSPL